MTRPSNISAGGWSTALTVRPPVPRAPRSQSTSAFAARGAVPVDPWFPDGTPTRGSALRAVTWFAATRTYTRVATGGCHGAFESGTALSRRARRRLGEKSGGRGPLAHGGSVADQMSRGQERPGGDAAERAEFRIHVGVVAVLRVERHVCQPHRSRGLELTERSDESAGCARAEPERPRSVERKPELPIRAKGGKRLACPLRSGWIERPTTARRSGYRPAARHIGQDAPDDLRRRDRTTRFLALNRQAYRLSGSSPTRCRMAGFSRSTATRNARRPCTPWSSPRSSSSTSLVR
jgi:hypothetical protein